MYKNAYFFILCFCFTNLTQAQVNHPFKMRSSQLNSYIPVNRTISSLDSIDLDTINIPIEGLSITGRLMQPCDSSFVRILLEDTLGIEYIVLESSRLYNDVDTLMLDDYCMETSVLLDVVPRKVRVFIRNATIEMDSIKYITHNDVNGNFPHHIAMLNTSQNDVRREQALEIVNHINEYNQNHLYLWVADTTQLSLLPWTARKITMGLDDDSNVGGLEYYVGGIFEFPRLHYISLEEKDSIWNAQLEHSPYVETFDWRNRHSKNWITSAKNQLSAPNCWAFSAIGALESVTNLYFNQLLNLDLSEQELVACSNVNNNERLALIWIRDNGIIDEISYPYQPDDTICDAPDNYLECVSIQSIGALFFQHFYPDSIKKHLIENGPQATSYHITSSLGHAVVLVGYGVMHEGDTLEIATSSFKITKIVVPPEYPHIGKTYWIFKNSYAGWDPDYLMMYAPHRVIVDNAYILTPITTINYSDEDIICEDADGDGYYFWGIGSKPSHCPAWVPDEPDGDDSDDTKGPMNEYGYLYDLIEHINDTIYVNSDTTWNQKRYLYNHVVIQNGAKLTITNDVTFYKTVTITIRDSSTLMLDGGRLLNADVKIDEMSGSSINIIHNGIIERRENSSFLVPLGNKMKINYGKVT